MSAFDEDDGLCPCLDFEPIDDDPLTEECVCGHVREEHENGFFTKCTIPLDSP